MGLRECGSAGGSRECGSGFAGAVWCAGHGWAWHGSAKRGKGHGLLSNFGAGRLQQEGSRQQTGASHPPNGAASLPNGPPPGAAWLRGMASASRERSASSSVVIAVLMGDRTPSLNASGITLLRGGRRGARRGAAGGGLLVGRLADTHTHERVVTMTTGLSKSVGTGSAAVLWPPRSVLQLHTASSR